MTYDQIMEALQQEASPQAVEGMARFGIRGTQVLGISIPVLRKIAKAVGKDHQLALQLWDSGLHEARILASMVAEPQRMSEQQIEAWVSTFDSWISAIRCVGSCSIKRLLRTKKPVSGVSESLSLCAERAL